jgi:hypothetical protein
MSRVQSLVELALSLSLAQNGQPAGALRDGEGLRELQTKWRWLRLEGVDVASGGLQWRHDRCEVPPSCSS